MAKDALNKIDEKKRERIFRNAAAEFARHGYHKANINSIAQKAGIGKGSIYLYFADKRDLYYSTFKEAVRIHKSIFDGIENLDMDPITKIEKVFRESFAAFPHYRNMFKMYFDLSSSGDEKSHASLAQMLEKRSAEFFVKVLKEGIEQGCIREDLPVEYAAYIVDCVYSMFFAALACRYQEERFRVFTGRTAARADGGIVEKHMREILNVIETGIAVPPKKKRTRHKGLSKVRRDHSSSTAAT
jgi:AcrR family transcriptional regulator